MLDRNRRGKFGATFKVQYPPAARHLAEQDQSSAARFDVNAHLNNDRSHDGDDTTHLLQLHAEDALDVPMGPHPTQHSTTIPSQRRKTYVFRNRSSVMEAKRVLPPLGATYDVKKLVDGTGDDDGVAINATGQPGDSDSDDQQQRRDKTASQAAIHGFSRRMEAGDAVGVAKSKPVVKRQGASRNIVSSDQPSDTRATIPVDRQEMFAVEPETAASPCAFSKGCAIKRKHLHCLWHKCNFAVKELDFKRMERHLATVHSTTPDGQPYQENTGQTMVYHARDATGIKVLRSVTGGRKRLPKPRAQRSLLSLPGKSNAMLSFPRPQNHPTSAQTSSPIALPPARSQALKLRGRTASQPKETRPPKHHRRSVKAVHTDITIRLHAKHASRNGIKNVSGSAALPETFHRRVPAAGGDSGGESDPLPDVVASQAQLNARSMVSAENSHGATSASWQPPGDEIVTCADTDIGDRGVSVDSEGKDSLRDGSRGRGLRTGGVAVQGAAAVHSRVQPRLVVPHTTDESIVAHARHRRVVRRSTHDQPDTPSRRNRHRTRGKVHAHMPHDNTQNNTRSDPDTGADSFRTRRHGSQRSHQRRSDKGRRRPRRLRTLRLPLAHIRICIGDASPPATPTGHSVTVETTWDAVLSQPSAPVFEEAYLRADTTDQRDSTRMYRSPYATAPHTVHLSHRYAIAEIAAVVNWMHTQCIVANAALTVNTHIETPAGLPECDRPPELPWQGAQTTRLQQIATNTVPHPLELAAEKLGMATSVLPGARVCILGGWCGVHKHRDAGTVDCGTWGGVMTCALQPNEMFAWEPVAGSIGTIPAMQHVRQNHGCCVVWRNGVATVFICGGERIRPLPAHGAGVAPTHPRRSSGTAPRNVGGTTATSVVQSSMECLTLASRETAHTRTERGENVVDAQAVTWQQIHGGHALPTRMHSHGVHAFGHCVYVVGGVSDKGSFHGRVWRLDVSSASAWVRLASMPRPRSGFGSAVLYGHIFVVGGWDGTTHLRCVQCYDVRRDVWVSTAPMPTRRYALACVAARGLLYAIGGGMRDGNATGETISLGNHHGRIAASTVVEVYNPRDNTWRRLPSLRTARMACTCVVMPDGRVWVMGGQDTDKHPLSSVEVYDPVAAVWSPGPALPVAVTAATACVLPPAVC